MIISYEKQLELQEIISKNGKTWREVLSAEYPEAEILIVCIRYLTGNTEILRTYLDDKEALADVRDANDFINKKNPIKFYIIRGSVQELDAGKIIDKGVQLNPDDIWEKIQYKA